jgi:hypothetical protein
LHHHTHLKVIETSEVYLSDPFRFLEHDLSASDTIGDTAFHPFDLDLSRDVHAGALTEGSPWLTSREVTGEAAMGMEDIPR